MPCAKNAFSLSELKLSNGRTAIDFVGRSSAPVGGDEAGLLRLRSISNTSRPVARIAIVTIRAANFRGLQDGSTSSGETFLVRFIPPGVASKAQEINTTMAKPKIRNTTNAFITQLGASKVGSRIDAA